MTLYSLIAGFHKNKRELNSLKQIIPLMQSDIYTNLSGINGMSRLTPESRPSARCRDMTDLWVVVVLSSTSTRRLGFF